MRKYIYVVLAVLMVLSLTPLVISHVSAEVKLLTLYATGAGVLHAIFYCGFLPVIKDTKAAGNIDYNWFMLYIVLATAIPMLTSVPFLSDEVHSVVVVLLTTGLLLNNIYLHTEGKVYKYIAALLYTLGTSYCLIKFFDIESMPNGGVSVGLMTLGMAGVNLAAVEWLFRNIRCKR